MKCFVESPCGLGRGHVHEPISHVALVTEINGKVDKIVGGFGVVREVIAAVCGGNLLVTVNAVVVQHVEQELLPVFIGYIFYHDSGS
nr:hypothetical protein Iba_chr15cCG6700 [Ipomoea batatas]GME11520.1 hypothetical protein Iba_scaffold11827CG0030 [Ipomoea batatas]